MHGAVFNLPFDMANGLTCVDGVVWFPTRLAVSTPLTRERTQSGWPNTVYVYSSVRLGLRVTGTAPHEDKDCATTFSS